MELTTIVKKTQRGYEMFTHPGRRLVGGAQTRKATAGEKAREGIRGRATWVTVYNARTKLVGYSVAPGRNKKRAAQTALSAHLVFNIGKTSNALDEVKDQLDEIGRELDDLDADVSRHLAERRDS